MAKALSGLVLTGGRSRRMGTDKALLRNGDESQVARAVRLLNGVCDNVFVSTRADQADEPERARFAQITDRYDDMGPVAGILSAMDERPDDDWLVVACDLPNLSEETLSTLVAAHNSDASMVAFRSTHNDLPEPLCAIYTSGSRASIQAFVDDGIKCPRKMMINSRIRMRWTI